jgi:hypothetical protein
MRARINTYWLDKTASLRIHEFGAATVFPFRGKVSAHDEYPTSRPFAPMEFARDRF